MWDFSGRLFRVFYTGCFADSFRTDIDIPDFPLRIDGKKPKNLLFPDMSAII